MSLSILADENIPAVDRYFAGLGETRLVDGRQLKPEQLAGADVLLVRSVTRVNAALLADSPVQFVGTATSGVDHIDREYLAGAGVGFASAPGANANSVVEYVLAMIAAVDDTLERLMSGGSVGVVGYGAIGRSLVVRLQRLGIQTRVYDPWLNQAAVPGAVTLGDVLACDVVSLHPELTTQQPWPSFHLLGSDQLSTLHDGQLLINASRGEVVDTQALCRLLTGGKGPVTVLDVWEDEPDIGTELASQVRIGTAHIAGYSLDGKLAGTRMLRDALLAHLGLERTTGGDADADTPIIEVTGDCSGPDLVRRLIQERYDIWQDHRLLRASLEEPEPAVAFDRLRKEYRVRRELAGTTVSITGATDEQMALVRALGCIPLAHGAQL